MLTLEEGAQRTVSYTGIRADERVLVLYDDVSNAGPAWALRRAATAGGANAHVRYLDRGSRDDGGDALDAIVDELVDLDVVIAFTRGTVVPSAAAVTAVSHGARVYAMAGASERTLTQGPLEADFGALATAGNFLAERLSDATHAELYTPAGTRLTMSLAGRRGILNPPSRPQPGVYRFPYAGVVIAPVEESVHGTVVIDAGPGVGAAPTTLTIERGLVTGGAAGTALADLVAADIAAANRVGMVGFGMNPAASLQGPAYEHTAVAGTGHLAFGPNGGIGGGQHHGRYVELGYAKPSLFLNGTQVMRAGVIESALTVS
ncbi:MAG: hypothetical protein GEV07_02460 [Streptosporangiales bacterium]|nr:hypothetical protein [Streptosporangiales bacterium]